MAKTSSSQDYAQSLPTLIIKMDSAYHSLDSTFTIHVDTATLKKLEKIINEYGELRGEIDSIKQKQDSIPIILTTTTWKVLVFIWGFIVTVGLIFILVFYFVKDRKKRRNDIVDIVTDSRRIQQWLSSNLCKQQNGADLSEKIADLDKKFNEIKGNKEHSLSSSPNGNTVSSTAKNVLTTPRERKLYAESIQENRYVKVKEVPTDDAIFELTPNLNRGTATVTIYKRSYQKVLANPSYLDGCDRQVSGSTSVNVTEEGIAELSNENKWLVRKQIRVTLK